MTNTELATWLHDNYEGLAKAFQWETQKETRVSFEELPIKNKTTMLALADRMNNTFLIIARQADVISWVAVSERMPEYDGKYLCFVRHQQKCGNIWEYQKVIECSINTWIVMDGEQVTHWKQLPPPPCI